jgi:hypothetical protein
VWTSLVVFAVLPLAVVGLSVSAVLRLAREPTSRLGIGIYLMLTGLLVTSAPIVWGDVHLGLPGSQVLEVYGTTTWAAGAVLTIASLSDRLRRGQSVAVALGCIVGAIAIGGWALSGPSATLLWSLSADRFPCVATDCAEVPAGVTQAVALALIPMVGTVELALVLSWLRRRLRPNIDWARASLGGLGLASVLGVYMYTRGPSLSTSPTTGLDLLLLACVSVLVLARWAPRIPNHWRL